MLHNTKGYMKNGLAIRFATFQWLDVSPQAGNLAPGASMDLTVTFDMSQAVRNPKVTVPVHVEVIPNQAPVITAAGVSPQTGPKTAAFQFAAAAHDPDGQISDKYWTFGDNTAAVHEFAPTHTYAANGKYTATFTAVDNDGYTTSANVIVNVTDPASASWNPGEFNFRLAGGQTAFGTLALANAGPGALVFGSDELPNAAPRPERTRALGSVDPNARTAAGLYDPAPVPERSPWLPEDVGSVVTRR